MHILQIDSSILGDASASRLLTAAIVDELCRQRPAATILRRDVVAEPIPHLDGVIAAGFRPIQGSGAHVGDRREHARSEQLVRELLDSDVIVVGAPMYNFSVSSQLKAWIDRVVQPGMTFRYTEQGPVGLAGGKRVIVASTRGGMYSAGAGAAMDFQEAYLAAVFRFMGVYQVLFVRAENLSRGAEARAQSLQGTSAAIDAVVRLALASDPL